MKEELEKIIKGQDEILQLLMNEGKNEPALIVAALVGVFALQAGFNKKVIEALKL